MLSNAPVTTFSALSTPLRLSRKASPLPPPSIPASTAS